MSGLTQSMLFASLENAFLPVFVDATVKACVIALLAGLTARMLSRSSAAIRHLVWCVAFLAFLLLPIIASTAPKWQVLPGWLGAGISTASALELGTRSVQLRTSSSPSAAETRDLAPQPGTAPAALETDSTRSIAVRSPEESLTKRWFRDFLGLSRLVVVVWSLGLGLLLLRTVCSRFILERVLLSANPVEDGPIGDGISRARRQLGIKRPVNVYLSSRRGTPMTWGLLRTYLLLPAEAASWGRRRLGTVVLHELAHVKRCDTITHVLSQLICAIYWFHPFVWLAARRLRVECERACDDLVLQSGARASDYADDLLSLLVQRAIPCTALAITGRSELECRLRAILDEKVNRGSLTKRILALALLVSVTSTTALAVLQAPNQPATKAPATQSAITEPLASLALAPPVEKVNLLCVDADGKPVAGAEVHLFQRVGEDDGRYVHSGPFTSDAAGKAVGADAIFSDGRTNLDRWIYARVPGRLIGVARCTKWTNHAATNPEGRVALRTSRSIEGIVTVPPGFDPTKVVVRVCYLHAYSGSGFFDYDSFPRHDQFPGLDSALPEIFECRPDSKGRIRFGDIPVAGQLTLVTAGDGLGEAQWTNENRTFEQPIQLTIAEENFISGRVLTPEKSAAVGMKVTARLSVTGRLRNLFLTSFRAVTDRNGEFAIRGLPQTEFVLSVEDPNEHWVIRPLKDLFVDPHKDPHIVLNMENGVPVSGRVLDTAGKPVQGASVSVVADGQAGAGLAHDSTDAGGRYQFRLPSGSARLYFSGLPDGFAYPNPQVVKELKIEPGQADIQNLDFTLQRK